MEPSRPSLRKWTPPSVPSRWPPRAVTPSRSIPSTSAARQSAITSFQTACLLIPCLLMTPRSPRTRRARRQTAAVVAGVDHEAVEAVEALPAAVAGAVDSRFAILFLRGQSGVFLSSKFDFVLHDHGTQVTCPFIITQRFRFGWWATYLRKSNLIGDFCRR